MTSLGEFITKAKEDYGCTVIEDSVQLVGPDGESSFSTIKRLGTDYQAILPNLDLDEYLTPHVLRSLCNRLDIDPSDFGFHLG